MEALERLKSMREATVNANVALGCVQNNSYASSLVRSGNFLLTLTCNNRNTQYYNKGGSSNLND